jgi:KaiC/GvpD/RAD55 family RecA-like ATPase
MPENNLLKEDFEFIEKLVMKNCLENEQFLSITIPYLKTDLFSNKHNKRIVELLQKYFSKFNRKPTSTELLVFLNSDKLKEAYSIVKNNSDNITEEIDYNTLLDHTERFLKLQGFQNTLLQIAEKWDSVTDKEDLVSFYNNVEKIIGYSLRSSEGHNYFDELETHIDNLLTETNHLSTGIEWLDNLLGGGFLQEGRSMYIFAGETNVGKSIFLHNMAVNIMKQNKKVILFSLEMSEQMYNIRITSTISELDNNTLKDNVEGIRDGAMRFKMMRPDAGLIVKEYPPNSVTPAILKTYTKQIISTKKFKPDAIVVDYLNLLTSDGNNSYEKIKNISEQLRALSYEFQCPVITATQLNRSGYNGAGSSSQAQVYDQRGPGMSSVSESYGTGATADAVVGLFRTDQDKEDNAIHVNIMKNRFGNNHGVTRLGMNYRTMTVFEDEALNENDEVGDIELSAGEYGEKE